MKRILIAALLSAAAVNGFAQGAIDVGNNFGASVFRARIYGPEVGDSTIIKTGQTVSPDFPTGAQTYTGTPLAGSGFTFGFFASTSGITADANSLTQIGTLAFGTAGTAGFVTTATMNVAGVAAGNPTTFQIRVWDNQGGTINTWSEAFNAWQAGTIAAGVSQLVNTGPLGGVGPGGPVTNPQTTGWTSFNIYTIGAVPEPGTFVLAGLGAAGMLIFRRRK